MEIRPIFHHVSILSGSDLAMRKCEDFYIQHFGMRIVKASGGSPEEGFSFLAESAGQGGMPLEIIGEAWEEREREFIRRHGPGIDHLAFVVEDTDLAVRHLEAIGLDFHIPPYDFLGTRIAWCRDPSGVDVEIMQATDVDFSRTSSLPRGEYHEPQFNHAGILTGSRDMAEETEEFYQLHFRMRSIHRGDPPDPSQDWVYLEDSSGANPLWLEVVGPALWADEHQFLREHGPGLDHLCFIVEEIEAFHQSIEGGGIVSLGEILQYGDMQMFYLRDPVGNSIQVMEKLGE
jgi:catechol 2,3-dioxygenase-like lactoylglutathione lyase family enzyme